VGWQQLIERGGGGSAGPQFRADDKGPADARRAHSAMTRKTSPLLALWDARRGPSRLRTSAKPSHRGRGARGRGARLSRGFGSAEGLCSDMPTHLRDQRHKSSCISCAAQLDWCSAGRFVSPAYALLGRFLPRLEGRRKAASFFVDGPLARRRPGDTNFLCAIPGPREYGNFLRKNRIPTTMCVMRISTIHRETEFLTGLYCATSRRSAGYFFAGAQGQ
jgi:hypothetical protein